MTVRSDGHLHRPNAVLNEKGEIIYANLKTDRILVLERLVLRGRRHADADWHLQRLDGTPLPTEKLPFRHAVAHGGIVRSKCFVMHWPDRMWHVLSENEVPL